jgi:putative intracellular protease/amidase
MPRALLLVADGSEEIEFVTPYDGTFAAPSLKKRAYFSSQRNQQEEEVSNLN